MISKTLILSSLPNKTIQEIETLSAQDLKKLFL